MGLADFKEKEGQQFISIPCPLSGVWCSSSIPPCSWVCMGSVLALFLTQHLLPPLSWVHSSILWVNLLSVVLYFNVAAATPNTDFNISQGHTNLMAIDELFIPLIPAVSCYVCAFKTYAFILYLCISVTSASSFKLWVCDKVLLAQANHTYIFAQGQ